MNENDIIRQLVEKYGTEEFLAWAEDMGIVPTYSDALYWLIKVKGLTGDIKI